MDFMKFVSACSAIIAASLVIFAQAQIDDQRWNEIRQKHARGEKITEEERDYYESKVERKNQTESAARQIDWAKQHPAQDSTGMIPLPDLGAGKYKGEQGGLYPDGSNQPPQAHLDAGLKLMKQIVPLDAQGRPAPDGRIVFCSIGMSNTTQETRSFLKMAIFDPSINPKVKLVDCAQGAQTASKIKDPSFAYWQTVAGRLRDAGVTAAQVQVVWVKEANAMPKEPFPEHAKILQNDMLGVMHTLHGKFPNLKIAYLSSRIYGGYAVGGLNPEPAAYEEGFSMKWLIADQIAGKPELNYDAAKGAVRAPWMIWGPYLWADGLKGRNDGKVTWKREDLGPDGTHPSLMGREKVAWLLMSFLKTHPTACPWFLAAQ
jgi:hypothetical protein